MNNLKFTVGLYIDYDIINYFGEDSYPQYYLKIIRGNYMKNFHRQTTNIAIISFMLTAIPMILPAQTLSQVLNGQTERTLLAQDSQQRVDTVVEQTRKMEDKYRATLKEIDGLQIYNKLLELQIENQARVKVDLEKSIVVASQINRQIVPTMTKMIESLDQFVSLDIPFLLDERTKRVDSLKEIMGRQDVTVAEKFRKVSEAYQIENDYGKTIETYKDTLDVDGKTLQLDFLKVGRISFMYQSIDGNTSGVWNQRTKQWEDADSHRNEIKMGLKIAKKQIAPDLVILPVDSAETI
tara:strand:+ start:4806 stop:5690 length:885 start_codon:yes stop_codon:yes gene_type:complete